MEKEKLTIDDIARELGVSKTTVSRALSGKGRISATTREKVLSHIRARNYWPSAAARGLAERRTYNLALVLPRSFIRLDLPYIRQAMNAICEEAFNWNYNIVICLSTDLYPESLLRTLDNRKVDGVILSRTVEKDALVDILLERGMPFATIGSLSSEMQGSAAVEADHDQVGGCYAFAKMVLQGSDQPIALLGNDMRYIVNKSRMEGFRKAVDELDFPEDKICSRMGLDSFQMCADTVNELLDRGVRRFLTMDDDICACLLRVLEQGGRVGPGEVELYSFADSERLDGSLYPVSAIRFDASELGQVACRELLCCLRNEIYDPRPVLGYRIIRR